MKLQIPKPITEIDIRHEEPPVRATTRRWSGMPDYTSESYGPPQDPAGALYIGNGQWADGDFRQSIIEDCQVEGFIPGSVVVHKKIEMSKRIDPLHWGIIISHNSTTSRQMPWKPLRVKWLSGSYDDLHATDCIIMMNVPDKSILKRRALGDPNPNPL